MSGILKQLIGPHCRLHYNPITPQFTSGHDDEEEEELQSGELQTRPQMEMISKFLRFLAYSTVTLRPLF